METTNYEPRHAMPGSPAEVTVGDILRMDIDRKDVSKELQAKLAVLEDTLSKTLPALKSELN
jgi:hypothetical protein